MAVEIPDKSYFKIGEVGRIVGVEPYNIRYWESQFRSIKPLKTKSNQRLYRRRDIEFLLEIKHLLYEEGFTIAGAKKRLKVIREEDAPGAGESSLGAVGLAREERRAYEDLLSKSQTELVDLRKQVQELMEDLKRQRVEHATQIAVLEGERLELTNQLEAVEPTVHDDEAMSVAKSRIETLQDELARVEGRYRDLIEMVRREMTSLRRMASDGDGE